MKHTQHHFSPLNHASWAMSSVSGREGQWSPRSRFRRCSNELSTADDRSTSMPQIPLRWRYTHSGTHFTSPILLPFHWSIKQPFFRSLRRFTRLWVLKCNTFSIFANGIQDKDIQLLSGLMTRVHVKTPSGRNIEPRCRDRFSSRCQRIRTNILAWREESHSWILEIKLLNYIFYSVSSTRQRIAQQSITATIIVNRYHKK